MNPFTALDGGPMPAWESDEERDEIAAQDIVQDAGPMNDPEGFAKNKAILDARDAQTKAALAAMNSQPAQPNLAQSSYGTSSMINAGQMMA